MNAQLFPKPAKRLRQPRKELLRDELRRAADTIIELRAENQRLRWWERILRWLRSDWMTG